MARETTRALVTKPKHLEWEAWMMFDTIEAKTVLISVLRREVEAGRLAQRLQ